MSLARSIKCDITGCGMCEVEVEFGVGWPGWSIVQGISVRIPTEESPIRPSDMTIHICPRHTRDLALSIDNIIDCQSIANGTFDKGDLS